MAEPRAMPTRRRVNGRSAADTKAAGNDDRTFRDKPFSTVGDGLKPKDLMMMPARLVLALQADGWWLRSMLPWLKRNPMPESTRDRPTSAIEYVFLLTRAERYFYDGEAVKTAYAESSVQRLSQPTFETQTGGPKDKKTGNRSHRKVLENIHNRVPAGWASSETYQDQDPRYAKRKQPRGLTPRHEGHVNYTKLDETGRGATAAMRNTRLFYQSLEAPHGMICSDDGPLAFDVATAPFHEAHFATFPTALVEPCIKAGCPAGGVVLDPFGGSGTTGLVADRLGRDAILIEINPEYAELARKRIEADGTLFSDVRMEGSAA